MYLGRLHAGLFVRPVPRPPMELESEEAGGTRIRPGSADAVPQIHGRFCTS